MKINCNIEKPVRNDWNDELVLILFPQCTSNIVQQSLLFLLKRNFSVAHVGTTAALACMHTQQT